MLINIKKSKNKVFKVQLTIVFCSQRYQTLSWLRWSQTCVFQHKNKIMKIGSGEGQMHICKLTGVIRYLRASPADALL